MNQLPNTIYFKKMFSLWKQLIRYLQKPLWLAGTGVVILLATIYYEKTSEENTIVTKETIDRVTFTYDRRLPDIDNLHARIVACYNNLKAKFGPALFTGTLYVTQTEKETFSKFTSPTRAFIGLSQPFTIEFITDTEITHELSHVYQANVFNSFPDFALEGLASYMANQSAAEQNLYIHGWEKTYLESFPGRVNPNAQFNQLPANLKNTYYIIGCAFFSEVARIDSVLLINILNLPVKSSLSWEDFLKLLLKYTSEKDKLLHFFNTCNSISDVYSKGYYFIPVRLESSVLEVAVYLEDSFSTDSGNSGVIAVQTQIYNKDKVFETSKTVQIVDGFGKMFLDLKSINSFDRIEINGLFMGKPLTQTINVISNKQK